MAAAESVRKLVSLAVIALLIGASAWLHAPPAPDGRDVETAANRPESQLATRDVDRRVPAPSSPHSPADANSLPAEPAARSQPVQSRLRVDSEPGRVPLAVSAAGEREEPRTHSTITVAEPILLAAALPILSIDAPDVRSTRVVASSSHGVVSGAIGTAARQTGAAFRIAGRAIRTAF
jgi:hypothetical protein